jgi:hypothetical protein
MAVPALIDVKYCAETVKVASGAVLTVSVGKVHAGALTGAVER